MADLVYRDKTRILRRCLFDVQNEVGIGRQEEAYHQACTIWLRENGVPFTSKQAHHLKIGQAIAHTLYPDLVCWDAIVVELKAAPRRLREPDLVQIFDYLKCRGDRVGLMVNMGLDRVHVERIAWKPPTVSLEEDWSSWRGAIKGRARKAGLAVQRALRAVYDAHGTGYGAEATERLVRFSLGQQGLSCVASPVVKSHYQGREVGESPIDCLVVDGCSVLAFTALFDSNSFNISRCASFMTALDVHWGVAANFGKKKAEFTGLHIKG